MYAVTTMSIATRNILSYLHKHAFFCCLRLYRRNDDVKMENIFVLCLFSLSIDEDDDDDGDDCGNVNCYGVRHDRLINGKQVYI